MYEATSYHAFCNLEVGGLAAWRMLKYHLGDNNLKLGDSASEEAVYGLHHSFLNDVCLPP